VHGRSRLLNVDTVPRRAAKEKSELPQQTPLFHALEQPRYSRQTQIRDIETVTGRRLICYIAGPAAVLSGFDVPPFVDLLNDVNAGDGLDLLLHTYGGDIDQAERIVLLCRKIVGAKGSFRVVVPDSAKSAGTLIAVGADEIVMGPSSELGPIDPQIEITTANGERMTRPAQSFLDGLQEIVQQVGTGQLSSAYFPLLDKLDPALIDFCKKALARSQTLAERFLSTYSLRGDPKKAAAIAAELINVNKYLSHGALIDAGEAQKLGLKVKEYALGDPLWQRYWRLYCELRVALQNPAQRLYESGKVSIAA
jgi:serine dehydrogenase proteinase